MQTETRELLAEYARLLNERGPDSYEADAFVGQNTSNPEFVELAEVSRALKKALNAPAGLRLRRRLRRRKRKVG